MRVFGERVALQDVSLSVGGGEIHALLGPNGAGKTTLLRILAGLLARTGGSLRVAGSDPSAGTRAFRSRIGLVPAGDRTFYLRISGLENLVFFARLNGLGRRTARRRALALLETFGLGDARHLRVAAYSQGMQKRLAIARALLTEPELLLIDEATHDLDPEGARIVRGLVAELAGRGTGVVWATQRLDEVVGFADRVTLLGEGVCRFSGSVHALAALAGSRRYVVRIQTASGGAPSDDELAAAVGSTATIERIEDGSQDHYLLAVADGVALGDALVRIARAGFELLNCHRERSQIEEAFLLLTGSGAS